MYMNSMPTVLLKCTPYLYADDTALVVSGDTEEEIVNSLTFDLNACSEWLTDHRLSLNVSKTKLMFFGTQARTNVVVSEDLVFHGGTIDKVDEYKYLGMMLDARLRFDRHAKYVRSKIIPKMRTLGKIRNVVTKNTALYLFNSLIKPVFEYNDYIYDPLTQDDANSLEVLQNSCLRICLKQDRYTSRDTLYAESGVCPLSKA